jgi:hypothetical protein
MNKYVVKGQWRPFTGTGDTEKEASINGIEKVLTYYRDQCNAKQTNVQIAQSMQENFLWATACLAALTNGVSVTYQFPTDHHEWKSQCNLRACWDGKNHHGKTFGGSAELAPPMFFIGFGRSPEEAKRNAVKSLHDQCAHLYRHYEDTTIPDAVKLEAYIDELIVLRRQIAGELDVFTQAKFIKSPKDAFADAPKPVESEPVRVAS